MIASLAILLATFAGLGALSPLPGAGVRLFLGGAIAIILLYALIVAAGLPVGAASWIVAALAAAGWVRLLTAARPSAALLAHPACVLPLLAVAATLLHGPPGYVPVAWDELANWLSRTRQMVVADVFQRPDMVLYLPNYTPGWPLLAAYPQALFGDFAAERAPAVNLALHIALMGLVFDAARRLPALAGSLLPAWVLVLGGLAVEATWRLAPTQLLIEKPQLYMLAAGFALSLAALYRPREARRYALALGLVAAAGYLVKVAMLLFLAPLGLFLLALWWQSGRDWRDGAALAGLAFGPFLLAYGSWALLAPAEGGHCFGSPIAGLAGQMALHGVPAHLTDTARAMGAGIGQYYGVYKLPLTLLAALGLALGAASDRRNALFTLGLAGFWLAYVLVLLVTYAYCFSEYERQTLASLERYARLPLRLLHLFGLLFLVAAVVGWAGRLPWRRAGRAAMVVGVVALAALQMRAVGHSLIEMRDGEGDWRFAENRRIGREAAALAAALPGGGTVALIVQGSDGYHHHVAAFAAQGRRPGEALHRFRLLTTTSWSPQPKDIWARRATAEEMAAALRGVDAVWPLRLDEFAEPVLAGLGGDDECRGRPGDFFFVREAEGFRCVAKPAADGG